MPSHRKPNHPSRPLLCSAHLPVPPRKRVPVCLRPHRHLHPRDPANPEGNARDQCSALRLGSSRPLSAVQAFPRVVGTAAPRRRKSPLRTLPRGRRGRAGVGKRRKTMLLDGHRSSRAYCLSRRSFNARRSRRRLRARLSRRRRAPRQTPPLLHPLGARESGAEAEAEVGTEEGRPRQTHDQTSHSKSCLHQRFRRNMTHRSDESADSTRSIHCIVYPFLGQILLAIHMRVTLSLMRTRLGTCIWDPREAGISALPLCTDYCRYGTGLCGVGLYVRRAKSIRA